MINLVKNALKFAVTGDIRIFVAYEEDEQLLKVQVVDNGKGIRSEEISKLFSYFGKLKRTANINSEGIGMGLMICQNLVRMNKGTILVHSKGENQGSVFSFTMVGGKSRLPPNIQISRALKGKLRSILTL